MIRDFISLIFPIVCASCGKSLYKDEQVICLYCTFSLPKTNYHLNKDNPIEKLFWGRVPIVSATAYYKFAKGGQVQQLIHKLKYKGTKEIGVKVGKLLGEELIQSNRFNNIDLIIPVPLHANKRKKRGYNQSESFAEGLAQIMKKETNFTSLLRTLNTDTQTKKARFIRWKNVESGFTVSNKNILEGNHILLVDDVITTGATLESCVHVLQSIPNVKVSIAAIAWASK